jgi:phosphoserine phosphatase RsbU/P
MNPPAPDGWQAALAHLVRGEHLVGATDIPRLAREAVAPLGLDAIVYLVDREQRALRALLVDADRPAPVAIDGTLAGRAFALVQPFADGMEPPGLWMPIVDGTERLGVLHLRPTGAADVTAAPSVEGARFVAGQIGHLIVSKSFYGDTIARTRRSRPMTPAAELLWKLLPPLTFATDQIVVTAVLEPCYDVGGDAFDYAVDGAVARVAVFDAVGRGLSAALTVAVTLAAIRAERRAGGDLRAMAEAADTALRAQFTDARFATAVLAELDLRTGTLAYVNAGHPAPLLLRRGRTVRALDGSRRPPLGVRDAGTTVAVERFEPGDRLLFYSDGVTEARDARGRMFGVERLVDAAERYAADGLPPAETARRLAHSVISYAGETGPQDDATLAIVEWSAAAAHASLP